MNNSAIDQLLPNPVPPRGTAVPTVADSTDRDLFRTHLQRATVSDDRAVPTPEDADETQHASAEATVDPETEKEETATTPQEEVASANESSEAGQPAEEKKADTETDDEVTLSAEATSVALVATTSAEIVVVAQQTGETQPNVESTSPDQQVSQGSAPFTANFVETTEEEQIVPTATASTDTESIVTASMNEGEAVGTQNTAQGESGSGGAQTGQQGEPTTGNVSAQSPTESQSDMARQVTATSETVENENSKRSGSHRDPKIAVSPASATSQVNLASVEVEIDDAKPHVAPEVTTAAHNAARSAAGSENLTLAGRAANPTLGGENLVETPGGHESPETPTVNRARFAHRVGGAIRTAHQRDGQIQLRLSPPELGTLRIQLTVQEGNIVARLETETHSARTILLDSLPALRERLTELNITIEKFDVDVGQQDQQPAEYQDADQRQPNGRGEQSAKTSQQPSVVNSLAMATAGIAQPGTDDRLDVRI